MATNAAGNRPVSTKKFLLTVLTLTLLMSLPGSVLPLNDTSADPAEIEWSRVNIPAEGETGNWVLASGSNIQHLTMTDDGTLYCYANPSGTNYTLFKSGDGGYSWSYTGGVEEAIVDIAAVPDDARVIYYVTDSVIYKSTDTGNSFNPLPQGPGGAGTGNITITCIDVIRVDNAVIVAAGTRDSDDSQFGGVYTLDESELPHGWLDTGVGSYDVGGVAFSPDFPNDRQLVAVVTDGQNTLVTTRKGNNDWGQDIGDATITGLESISAAIAFPDDYNATAGDCTLFVAIDTGSGGGDVYSIEGRLAPESSIATDLDAGALYSLSSIDITGLVVSGTADAASLLAGRADSAQVYISSDSGTSWLRSTKQPTGQSGTCLIMAPDFSSSSMAYCATTGTESAFSITTDGGITWNQAGLIDAEISLNGIINLAISPCYSQDGTLFMLTFDGAHVKHSLWRSETGGGTWERVFTSALDTVDNLKLIELSPGYGSSSQTVYLAGTGNGSAAIWKSTDNGQTFTYRSAPSSIDIWKVADDDTLFLGCYDGINALVYRTTDGGLSYNTGVAVGSQPLKSIVLSPDYGQDGTILVGNTDGWVYYSDDNGASFRPLPPGATSPPLSGSITVAFDSDFPSNNIVYAASDSSDEGIYRFIVGESTMWESIDSALPAGSTLSQLAVSADGTLYAVNSQPVDTVKKEGGVERSLNPADTLDSIFETVIHGLSDNVTLGGLWMQGSQLWSIDADNTSIMTFIDTLARPVTLTSPPDNARGTGISDVVLGWKEMNGATEYRWQLDYSPDFSDMPDDFEGDTESCSVVLPLLDEKAVYYWRVRATRPLLSRWSDVWYFVTTVDSEVPLLIGPGIEETGVPIKPVFEWSAVDEAERYELIVSINFSFTNPVIERTGESALTSTVWQSSIDLDYNTTYYWKVRACYSDSYGDWSDVGTFTTGSQPSEVSVPPETTPPVSPPSSQPSSSPPVNTSQTSPEEYASSPPQSPPSSSPSQQAIPRWLIYLTAASILAIVILVVTLLLVSVRHSRADRFL
jgi:photosystem II stability/assembly factor-like uncharacterized protein